MVEVSIVNDQGELGKILITHLEDNQDGTSDYSVQFVVDRCGAVGAHQRGIFQFPRTKYNALGLLTQALATLDEKELRLEDGAEASDLARRKRRALPKISRT